jgi:hypothetical protein
VLTAAQLVERSVGWLVERREVDAEIAHSLEDG